MESVNPCYFCLLRSACRDLNTPYTRLGVTEIYSQMFEDCFRIQLMPDNEENGICEMCVARLQDASDFKRQAVRSQMELRATLERRLEDEGSVMKKELEDNSEVTIKEEYLIYGEPTIKTDPADDAASERLSDPVAASVPASDLAASTPCASEPREQLGMTYYVDQYNTVGHEYSLAIHAKDMRDDSFGVVIEEASDSRGERSEPISLNKQAQNDEKRTHNPDQISSNKVTDSKRRRTTRSFVCDVCNKTFTQRCNLKRHKLIHTGEKPYACKFCDHKFTNPTGLKNHQYLHTGMKPYRCEICDKQYAQLNMLKVHERIHSGERPFKCELCSKKFRVVGDLKVHTKKHHTKEKYHACSLCEKQFFRKSDLKLHMTKHSGQQPFSCKLCDKKFLYGNDLRRHLLIHAGEKPYSCDMCNARFRQKVNVIKHIKNNVCGKPLKKKRQST